MRASITGFITGKLKLRVNSDKSAVGRPRQRKFLGFSFTGVAMTTMVDDLASHLRGWYGYYGHCQTPSVLQELERWYRRRLRSVFWKQWKRGRVRFAELRRRGVGRALAAKTAGSLYGPWRLANSPALSIALPNAYFASLGLPRLVGGRHLNPPNRRVRTRTHGGVTG